MRPEHWLYTIPLRLRSLLSRRRMDEELDEELRYHVDRKTEEYIAKGMAPPEARRAALLEMGGVEKRKEECRDARRVNWLPDLLQDLRYGLRVLRKSPGFTSVAVLALALGIGFSSIVFSIFYNGILNPFPYRDARRLSVIGVFDTQQNRRFREVYHLNEVAAFRERSRTLDDVVAYAEWNPVYLHQNTSEQLHGCFLTPNAMDFWGVPPVLGRGIVEQDARPGAPPVVVLSYAFWKRAFNGDRIVLGTMLTLNKQPYTIVGVMPRRFLLFGADIYVPIAWDRPEPASYAAALDKNDAMYFFATARLKSHVNRETAAADLQVIAKQLVSLYPREYPDHFKMTARGMNEVIVGDFKQTLTLLIAAVVLLLLISSSNVASLLLTHHTARSREIVLRTALGASRGRLIRQLLVESLLLGLAGCVAGCLLASAGLWALRFVPGVGVPGEADMSLNVPVLFFAIALSLLTTLLFGLSPTLLAVKRDIRSNLQGSGVNVRAGRGGVRVRAGLVIGQAALSMLLLVFAGLMIRSFLALSNFDPGMNTQGLLHAMIHFPTHQYDSIDAKRAFFDQTLPRISSLPGVTGTAVSFWFPLMGGPRSEDVTIPGKPHDKHWTTDLDGVSEDYFSTIGFRLLRGRLLSAADVAGARRVAVVSNKLAQSFFGDDDPLGRQIKFNDFDQMPELPHDAYFEIVGVVSDLKSFNLQEPMLPQAYIPYTFASLQDRSILVRSVTNPLPLVNSLRQVISGVDSNVLLMRPQTLDDLLQRFVYSEPKFRLVSFSVCAGIGLALALIGLFGILSYSVILQTHEIGVRMALGAQPGRIPTLILGKGLLFVGSGIVLGLLVAFLSVRILKSELWGVSTFDPWTLLLAPIAFLCVAFIACYVPARRAMRVDPMVALRCE